MKNQVERRHIEEAIAEVRTQLACTAEDDADAADDTLTLYAQEFAGHLRTNDSTGDAEGAHRAARRLAAVAIYYLARGLS